MKIQANVVLTKRGWKGSDLCFLCQGHESVDHIFFHCIMSLFVWRRLKQMLGWGNISRSVDDFFGNWVEVKPIVSQSFLLFSVSRLDVGDLA